MVDIGMVRPELGQRMDLGVPSFILGIIVLLQLTSQSLGY